jgi:pantoate--beta-alanine ligase
LSEKKESCRVELAKESETMEIIETVAAMKEFSEVERKAGRTVALVPTMGALHRGHVELFHKAAKEADTVVATIFVNPEQFGEGEDLLKYPKQLSEDILIAREAGVDLLFIPSIDEIYPPGFNAFVEPGPLSLHLCGRSRPGHFKGVATVVLRLFNITCPDIALFGLKDFQQLLVIRRMVRELDLDVRVIGVETVREEDGLAVSSRNVYLNAEERAAAAIIPRSLELARALYARGERDGRRIAKEVQKSIEKEPLAVVDYCVVSELESLEELANIESGALMAVAVRIGKARLIDNMVLGE